MPEVYETGVLQKFVDSLIINAQKMIKNNAEPIKTALGEDSNDF